MQATYVYFLILLLEYQRDKHWTQWEEGAPIGQGGNGQYDFYRS